MRRVEDQDLWQGSRFELVLKPSFFAPKTLIKTMFLLVARSKRNQPILGRVQVRTPQPKWQVQDSLWVSFYPTEQTGYTLARGRESPTQHELKRKKTDANRAAITIKGHLAKLQVLGLEYNPKKRMRIASGAAGRSQDSKDRHGMYLWSCGVGGHGCSKPLPLEHQNPYQRPQHKILLWDKSLP